MADRAVRLQVRAGTGVERLALVVRDGQLGESLLRIAAAALFLNAPQVVEHAELVVGRAVLVVLAVHLRRRQTEDKIRRPAVADHALGAAGIMPLLFRRSAIELA